MDDFQHRLLVALERLSGREGVTVDARLQALGRQLGELVMVLEDIRDRLPPRHGEGAGAACEPPAGR
jgi:hypothetical protein